MTSSVCRWFGDSSQRGCVVRMAMVAIGCFGTGTPKVRDPKWLMKSYVATRAVPPGVRLSATAMGWGLCRLFGEVSKILVGAQREDRLTSAPLDPSFASALAAHLQSDNACLKKARQTSQARATIPFDALTSSRCLHILDTLCTHSVHRYTLIYASLWPLC
jgi:hypothetical protein